MFTCWPITPNIAGFYMLRPFAHPVTCCFVLLGIVAQSLKPVKRLSQQVPTFLLFRDQRSVANNVGSPRLHGSSNIARATHAHYTWYPSSLQCLMGCILPTMYCRSQHCQEWLHPFAHNCQHGRINSQHCWTNNVESSLRPLHLLSIRLYTFFIAENIDTHLSYKTLSTKVFRNFSLSLLHSRFQCRQPNGCVVDYFSLRSTLSL